MMLTLYDPTTLRVTLERIGKLQPDSPRRWGQMAPAQMLAHCAAAMEVATGDQVLPRQRMGRLLGWWFRSSLTDNTPFKRNSPTEPSFVIADARDFDTEKARLLALVRRFAASGPEGAPKHPHGFFGKLSPTQWGGWAAKHLDHHLRQFGIMGMSTKQLLYSLD